MPDFDSFGDLSQAFLSMSKRADAAIQQELRAQGQAVTAKAKRLFGTYQDGWAQLADSTQLDRERKGFTPNDPLFRSGGLQGAVDFDVSHSVTGPRLTVGVPDGVTLQDASGKTVQASDVMIWQELGTGKIPPRPVFGIVQKQMEDHAHAFGIGFIHRIGL